MSKKKKSNINPDKNEESNITQLLVGDIQITTKSNLQDCTKQIKHILKDKNIRTYLDLYKQKKTYGFSPDYIS